MKGPGRWSAMGLALGALLGAALLTVGRSSAGPTIAPSTADADAPEIDVLHRSPLLVLPAETVSLDYEVVCATADPSQTCLGEGEVHVRAAGASSFTAMALERGADGVLRARVPAALVSTGFGYYATVRDATTGAERTLPAAGAAAPHRVWSMANRVTVDLGDHAFGKARRPDAVAVRAAWGTDRGHAGLDAGPEQARMGPGAFDVAGDGSIVLLDQVNRRVTTFAPGGRVTRQVGIHFEGGMGDLALAPDGRMVVVEDGGPGSATPVVRLLEPSGRQIAAQPLAERTAGMVRWSPKGAVVQQTPSDAWMQATNGTSSVLGAAAQVRSMRVGRLVDAAQLSDLADRVADAAVEVVVDATDHDTRVAVVSGHRVLAGWRVVSRTTLGEVQLFEPYRGGLLLVQRVYAEGHPAEFHVVHLTPLGARQRFTVAAAEWAEASPHSLFRLANGRLYQLRSTEHGIEIARFRLGGE